MPKATRPIDPAKVERIQTRMKAGKWVEVGICQGCRDEARLYNCTDKKGPCRLCRYCAFD